MSLKQNISFSHKDFEIQQQETTYHGYFKINQFHFKHRLFNGEWSSSIAREVLISGNSIGVLPYDPILNKVILNQQFRIGAINDADSPWLLEIIGGSLHKDSTHEETAYREAKEEAGLDLLDLELICEYWTAPAGLSEKVYLYCAHVDAKHVGGIHGLSDEGEDIKVIAVDVHDAFHAVANGIIKCSHAIIALQWLELNLKRISEKWFPSNFRG